MATEARRFSEQPVEGLPATPERARDNTRMLPDEQRGTLHINMHDKIDKWLLAQASKLLAEDPKADVKQFMKDMKGRPLPELISAMLVDQTSDAETAELEKQFVDEWKASAPEGTEAPAWIKELEDRIRQRKAEAVRDKPN